MMRVEQMVNNRGNGAMNQFIIYDDNKTVFQSYDSMIAEVDYSTQTITFGKDWNYSNTTGKHRNIFFENYVCIPQLASKKGIENALSVGKCGEWKVIEK